LAAVLPEKLREDSWLRGSGNDRQCVT
jgi:hypothetical protein